MLFFNKSIIDKNLVTVKFLTKEISFEELNYNKNVIKLINEIKNKNFQKELETKWLF